MARPLPLLPLPLLALLLLLASARCRMVDVDASTSGSSPGATATTTERVVVVTAQTVDRRKSRSHWPHTSPVTALHAFSSSAGEDWTAVAGVAKRDLKQQQGAPWQQRLQAEDEDAAVLHWKRAEDEKVLHQQEQRGREKERFVVGGAPVPVTDDDQSNAVDVGAEDGGQATSQAEHVEEEHGGGAEQPPSPSPTPAPAMAVDPNTRVRTLLAELQQVMQKYLRRSHREDRRYEDGDDNGLRPRPQHDSPWWPRPEELMRASLRVLVACRQGLEQAEHDPEQDAQGARAQAQDLLPRLRDCLRARLLAAVDNLVAAETVPIAFGVSLVRRPELRPGRVGRDSQDGQEVSQQEQQALAPRLLSRLADLFVTHDLRIGYGVAVEEGRRRHQYRKVFPILVTGFMILMSLMVPLGFQFMAMIGGKALLMSKMALIMASMYNFRRSNGPVVQPAYQAHHVPHIIDHLPTHAGPIFHERTDSPR